MVKGYLNTRETIKRFGVSKGGFYKIKNEEKMDEYAVKQNGIIYFPISFIEELEEKSREMFETLSRDYYTEEDVLRLVRTKTIPKIINEKRIYVPLLVRSVNKITTRKQFVYPKPSVQEYFDTLVEHVHDNPFLAFEDKVKREAILFPPFLAETKRIWFRFVKEQVLSSSKNEVGIKKMVNRFIKETKILTSIAREIHEMSEKELNLLFLSSKHSSNICIDMYKFLRYFHYIFKSEGKPIFNVDKLKSPYEKKNKGTKKDVSIYSYDEYKTFFDYANDLSIHKEKAMRALNETTNQYDASWLYVLMHLNNTWRSYDAATNIPRINPEKVGIRSLDDITTRDLTIEEANQIINQLKQHYMQHGKTGKQRRFFCSSHLAISMATALCICEFKTRMTNPTRSSLCEFNNKNKLFTTALQKEFFSDFNQAIRFESRKMNRTLLTFADSVIRKHTSGNSLETTKYLRGHDSIETTNIYVQIPQEHLDFLTEQLFARDSFGYVPELFAKLLYGAEENFETRTLQIHDITERLGDVYKLEWMSGMLNQFKEEKELVEQLFMTMNDEEMKDLHTKMTLDLLPSKEENFQCLVSESNCVYPMRACHTCPLSMPNYYAISSICGRVLKNIVRFNLEFETTSLPAEKTKLANFLHRDLQLLQHAMNKFGKTEVYQLLDVETDVFKEVLKQLPAHKQYITFGKGV